MKAIVLMLAFAFGCDSTSYPEDRDADAGRDARAEADATSDADVTSVVYLHTEDGLVLEADLYRADAPEGGAVLLHEQPSANSDRTNWPMTFIDELVERDVTVLNVARRGAAGSDGDATKAAGVDGKLDAAAAVLFLINEGIDMEKIVLVAASNGTTVAVDYAIYAQVEGLAVPRSLVLMTGGVYTENQNDFAGAAALVSRPILFVYSTEERAWSEGQREGAPEIWQFEEYADGAHGTAMFAAVPESIERVADFVGTTLD